MAELREAPMKKAAVTSAIAPFTMRSAAPLWLRMPVLSSFMLAMKRDLPPLADSS
jgi:hypothetical protein